MREGVRPSRPLAGYLALPTENDMDDGPEGKSSSAVAPSSAMTTSVQAG